MYVIVLLGVITPWAYQQADCPVHHLKSLSKALKYDVSSDDSDLEQLYSKLKQRVRRKSWLQYYNMNILHLQHLYLRLK